MKKLKLILPIIACMLLICPIVLAQGQSQVFENGETSAYTNMEIIQIQNQFRVTLDNGNQVEIIMPNVASEKAIEQLQLRVCSEENNCNIELKEVGNQAVYEVKAQKPVMFLGLFRVQMQVQAQINAENGETIQVKEAWWSFLANKIEE